jgi:hypothetical protein
VTAAQGKPTADLFHWLLFGHLVGVATLGAGLGTYVVALHRLVVARSVEQLGPARPVLVWGERTALGGYGLLIATGIWLGIKADAFDDAWLITSLVLLVALAAAGRYSGMRLTSVYRRLETEGAGDSSGLLRLARCWTIHVPADVSVLAVVELVYLMTLRPGGWGIALSLLALALGAIGAAWGHRRVSVVAQPFDAQ